MLNIKIHSESSGSDQFVYRYSVFINEFQIATGEIQEMKHQNDWTSVVQKVIELEKLKTRGEKKSNKKLLQFSIDETEPKENSSRLIPVTKWNNYHDWPSVGGLRHLIFFADTNGFKQCIRKVGRRVLIDELAFFEWVEKSQEVKIKR